MRKEQKVNENLVLTRLACGRALVRLEALAKRARSKQRVNVVGNRP